MSEKPKLHPNIRRRERREMVILFTVVAGIFAGSLVANLPRREPQQAQPAEQQASQPAPMLHRLALRQQQPAP